MNNYMIIKLSCVSAVALATAIWILYLVLTTKKEEKSNKVWMIDDWKEKKK